MSRSCDPIRNDTQAAGYSTTHRRYGVGERTRQTVLVACSTGSKRVNAEKSTECTELARELAKPCWWHVQLAASVSMQKKSTECTELATCQNRGGDVLKLGRPPAAIDP